MNLAHDPKVFTSDCANYEALPAGHVDSLGRGEHDIGMPKLPSEKDDDYVEATVRAGQPITIDYNIETAADIANDLRAEDIASNDRYEYEVIERPSYRQACSGDPIKQRTFIPKSGANYEARYMTYYGSCVRVEIFRIDTSSKPAALRLVNYVPTKSCDD